MTYVGKAIVHEVNLRTLFSRFKCLCSSGTFRGKNFDPLRLFILGSDALSIFKTVALSASWAIVMESAAETWTRALIVGGDIEVLVGVYAGDDGAICIDAIVLSEKI